MKQIFNVIKYSNYIPIFVYPFTPYSSLIYNRTIDRGIREGRFLKCDGEYGIAKMMPILLDGYKKIKVHIKKKFKDNQYLILQYISISQAEIDSLKDSVSDDVIELISGLNLHVSFYSNVRQIHV